MNTDPDHLLHRLVVAALTVFVTVSLLLAAFVFRELWLQQRIADLSANLEVNIADLEETTGVIQSEISEISANSDDAPATKDLDKVAELLTDADAQLETIGEEIDQVNSLLEPEPAPLFAEPAIIDEGPAPQDRADQVFTIFAVITGFAGIAIALLLGLAKYAEGRVVQTGLELDRGGQGNR
jgi:hypothetical protein